MCFFSIAMQVKKPRAPSKARARGVAYRVIVRKNALDLSIVRNNALSLSYCA